MLIHTIEHKKIFPAMFLTSLVTYNSSFTDVWMEVIADIKYKIDHFYLEESFLNYFDTKKIYDIYVSISVPPLKFSYIYW